MTSKPPYHFSSSQVSSKAETLCPSRSKLLDRSAKATCKPVSMSLLFVSKLTYTVTMSMAGSLGHQSKLLLHRRGGSWIRAQNELSRPLQG